MNAGVYEVTESLLLERVLAGAAGIYLGRYFGLGLSMHYSYLEVESNLDWLNPERKRGEFLFAGVSMKIRPSPRLVITGALGLNNLESSNTIGGVTYEAEGGFLDGTAKYE